MSRGEQMITHEFSAQFGFNVKLTARAVERGRFAGMTVDISTPNGMFKDVLDRRCRTINTRPFINGRVMVNQLVGADCAKGEFTFRSSGWSKSGSGSTAKRDYFTGHDYFLWFKELAFGMYNAVSESQERDIARRRPTKQLRMKPVTKLGAKHGQNR